MKPIQWLFVAIILLVCLLIFDEDRANNVPHIGACLYLLLIVGLAAGVS